MSKVTQTRQQYFHKCREKLWLKRCKIARNYLIALHKQGKLKDLPTEADVKLQVMSIPLIAVTPYTIHCVFCGKIRSYLACEDCKMRRMLLRAVFYQRTITVWLFDNGTVECDLTILNCLSPDCVKLIWSYL